MTDPKPAPGHNQLMELARRETIANHLSKTVSKIRSLRTMALQKTTDPSDARRMKKHVDMLEVCRTFLEEGELEKFLSEESRVNTFIKMNTKETETELEQVQPYISAGLTFEFAKAIVNGTNSNDVLDLWDSKWRKQYQPNDALIQSVLRGRIDYKQAERLNIMRSNHETLVTICLNNPDLITWAISLCDAGFDEFPEAISDILKGADPQIIARVRKIPTSGPLPSNPIVIPKHRLRQVYIDAGLPTLYSIALINGIREEDVLSLWESNWRMQYENDHDPLIQAVLAGKIDFLTAGRLNLIRSNHERLVLTALSNDDLVEWVFSLIECGFDRYPEAIEDVLDGGDPAIIARIRRIQLVAPAPPKLERTIKKLYPSKTDWAPTPQQMTTLQEIVENEDLIELGALVYFLRHTSVTYRLRPTIDGNFSKIGLEFVKKVASDLKNELRRAKHEVQTRDHYSSKESDDGDWYCFRCDTENIRTSMYCEECMVSRRAGSMENTPE